MLSACTMLSFLRKFDFSERLWRKSIGSIQRMPVSVHTRKWASFFKHYMKLNTVQIPPFRSQAQFTGIWFHISFQLTFLFEGGICMIDSTWFIILENAGKLGSITWLHIIAIEFIFSPVLKFFGLWFDIAQFVVLGEPLVQQDGQQKAGQRKRSVIDILVC